jgi:hypothetical protein
VDHPSFDRLSSDQANALAAVIELEAFWENVPVTAVGALPRESLRGLTAKQRAFDAYHAGLVAYNRRYGVAYHGERPGATPKRLGAWCRRLAALYRRADQADCSVQVLEKAHRCVDRIATRLAATACPRAASASCPSDVSADLGSIADWCERLSTA